MVMHPIDQLAPITAVRPDFLQGGFGASGQLLEDKLRPVSVLNVGCMNHYLKQVSDCINDDMPLAPVDLFACILPTAAACLGRFDALAVYDAGCRLRLALLSFPLLLAQRLIDPLPGAIKRPFSKMVVHAARRWKVGWQIRPLAASSYHIEHRIYRGTHVNLDGPAGAIVLQRQEGFDKVPLCIRQVTGV